MKLKGNMVIELTDTTTGAVETVSEENMVTSAVNYILGKNPLGCLYNIGTNSDTRILWNDNLLPICPNIIGGILLFSKALTEDTEHLYEGSDNLPVAYASNDVNSTADLARGSLNLTESKAIDNGYKFVWEFSATQGNGTIAAAALTSSYGGQFAYGSSVGDDAALLQLHQLSIGSMSDDDQQIHFEGVEFDFENEILTSLAFSNSAVVIRKVRVPTFTVGLNERLNDLTNSLISETAISVSTFKFTGTSSMQFGDFFDGGDCYWYCFYNGTVYSSGSATVTWVKISKSDYSMTEGSWTLSNATLVSIGDRYGSSSYPTRNSYCCVRGGYLYVMNYAKTGIYRINISNSADVTLLSLGFTSAWKSAGTSGSCGVYMYLIGDLIVGYDFQIDINDNIIQTAGTVKTAAMATQLFQHKSFMLCWGGSYGSEYRYMYLLTPYLATINNLDSAVVKDSSKTMKITYTLTEEDSE